jgi:hypothetical protein
MHLLVPFIMTSERLIEALKNPMAKRREDVGRQHRGVAKRLVVSPPTGGCGYSDNDPAICLALSWKGNAPLGTKLDFLVVHKFTRARKIATVCAVPCRPYGIPQLNRYRPILLLRMGFGDYRHPKIDDQSI